ncbi:hypothetical protein Goarm_003608 [Gossypium armourianum]|uniref:Uncharacterized protein n=1 Tax=Gossypium armourianum TaxID=34283 RepID=A0A7J9K3V0_9ROSI|nr:hypothetical protein [Gossypium armourianum]
MFLKAVVENQVLVVSGETNCARISSEKEENLGETMDIRFS